MAAAHYRYKTDTLTITPTVGDPISITGVQALRFGQGGETIDLMSDSSELVQEIPLGHIKGRLSITTLAQIVALGVALGECVISFTAEQVKNGRGAVTGADKVVEFPVCVIKDLDAGVASGPGESATIQADAVADDDGNIYTVEDAA